MSKRRGLFLVLSFLVFLFSFIPESVSADTWTISGSDSFTSTSGVALPITDLQLVSTSTGTTSVKLLVTSGTLSMPVTAGLTFDGATSTTALYFSGNLTNINNALASLTYTRSGTGSDTLEVSLVSRGEVFFADNGHLYQYISSTLTWTAAKAAAEALSAYGATGYLTTITSQSENDYVAARLLNAGWMGAADNSVEGAWRWVTGPENNTQFWSGASGGSTVGGNYANWGTGEPNDAGSNEDCAQFLSGGSGKWNDLPCTGTTLPGYVVEYGADGALPTVTAKNISITTSATPTISSYSPADNATSVATSSNLIIQFSQTVTTGPGSLTIWKSSDNSVVETINASSSAMTGGGTNTITINPTSDFIESTAYYITIASTTFKNNSSVYYTGITSSTTWNFTVGDFTSPVLSSIESSVISSSTANITWTTNEIASTRVHYGTTESLASSTALADISPRVTSHSVSLTGLVPCATYYYKVVSSDSSSNNSTSTNKSFNTGSCAGGAEQISATSTSITVSTEGYTILRESDSSIAVRTPSNFTSTSSTVVIQIHSLDSSTVLNSIGKPSTALQSIGDIAFDVKAIINTHTILDSFDTPVTITYEYDQDDVTGIDESTLVLYHYASGSWSALSNCSVNTSANSITCTAPHFSIFKLFGSPSSSASSAGLVTGFVYGCKDPKAINFEQFVSHRSSMCKYIGGNSTTLAIENGTNLANKLGTNISGNNLSVRDLKLNIIGDDVKSLQKLLNSEGYILASSGAGSPGNETNKFGVLTQKALSKYQKANGIKPAIGYFGPVTRQKMKELQVKGLWW